MYDITTTDALLLNGILTISFQKLKSALPNKVIIRNEQITK
jgi:HSP20 family molecular chaperone IbpA